MEPRLKSWKLLKNRRETLFLRAITIFTIKAIDVNTIAAIDENFLPFPFNQTWCTRSVFSNNDATYKCEEISIDAEFDEAERVKMGIETKGMPAVDNNTVTLLLPSNPKRWRSALRNANVAFKFEEIMIDMDFNKVECEIVSTKMKDDPKADNANVLLLKEELSKE